MFDAKFQIESMTISQFYDIHDQIDCDPIHQRLSRDDDKFTKSKGIINTLINGMSIGQITLHKLPEDYDYKYESIDGGHRKRAIVNFIKNKFPIKNKDNKEVFFKDFSDTERDNFRKLQLSFCIYNTLAPVEVGNIFRVLNEITEVTDQEILNSYGDHPIANAVREIVRSVPSRNNSYHELFVETGLKVQPYLWWHKFDNAGLRQDEWVARLFYRYYKGDGVGAADAENLRIMYDDQTLTQARVDELSKKVKNLLNFVKLMSQESKQVKQKGLSRGLKQHEATLFARLYLSLEWQYNNWTMKDANIFYTTVRDAHLKLSTDPGDINSDLCKPAKFDASKATWAWYKEQWGYQKSSEAAREAINMLLKELDIDSLITVRDPKRNFTREQREAALIKQNFKCAITGKPLTMENAHADHIIPWSKGGRTDETNLQMVTAEANLEKSNRLVDNA